MSRLEASESSEANLDIWFLQFEELIVSFQTTFVKVFGNLHFIPVTTSYGVSLKTVLYEFLTVVIVTTFVVYKTVS